MQGSTRPSSARIQALSFIHLGPDLLCTSLTVPRTAKRRSTIDTTRESDEVQRLRQELASANDEAEKLKVNAAKLEAERLKADAAKPEPEQTTPEPEPEQTTPEPEPEQTKSEPEPEQTKPEPEPETSDATGKQAGRTQSYHKHYWRLVIVYLPVRRPVPGR